MDSSLSDKKVTIQYDIKYINERINREVCNKTIEALTDKALLPKYKNSDSTKESIKLLESILDANGVDKEVKQKIIEECLEPFLIKAGTKGNERGNEFNRIVKKHIEDMKLDYDRFDICFEKKCKHLKNITVKEIPDWYIMEKSTRKTIIGMNQVDLWGGGNQKNRADKYMSQNDRPINITEKFKLVCVVCNYTQIKCEKNDYLLFNTGFSNDTLCYLGNLSNIIDSYFNI